LAASGLGFDILRVGLVDAADEADHVRGDSPSGYWRNRRACTSTPGKRKRCAVKRATSSSVRRVRSGTLSKFFDSSSRRLEALAVLRLDLDQLGQLVDHRVEAGLQLGRRDLERVGRIVARQDHAVAVDDQAAVGHDRHDRDAVVLGQRHVVVCA
jgi:hypothetical protein